MSNNVLIKLERYDSEYLRLKLYDRRHGSTGWGFLIDRDKLAKAINEHQDTYLDYDGYDFLIMSRINDLNWKVTLQHCKRGDPDDLRGFRMTVEIPEGDFKVLMLGYDYEIRRLHANESRSSRIVLSDRAMKHIPKDPNEKRAFIKALRDYFKWGVDSEIKLYPDGEQEFYFEETINGKRGICGGLVKSSKKVYGKDAWWHAGCSYSIHT